MMPRASNPHDGLHHESEMSFRPGDRESMEMSDAVDNSLQNGTRPATSASNQWRGDEAVRLYRHHEHFPGYTGHVPRLLQTHGTGYTNSTRYALYFAPAADKYQRPLQEYEQTRARRVITAAQWLPGGSFSGYALPTGPKGKGGDRASMKGTHQYLQGSSVDVNAYYKTLAAQDYKQLLIKSGSPAKARSNIDFGDRFYFNGPHMWKTTQVESFPKYDQTTSSTPTEQLRPSTTDSGSPGSPKRLENMLVEQNSKMLSFEAKDTSERAYQYKLLQAVVGAKRCNDIRRQLMDKISTLSGSQGRMMFKLFDKDNTGHVTPDIFHSICRGLGIHCTVTEAGAIYGQFDCNMDGEITFYEFLDHFSGQVNHNKYY